MTLPGPTPPPAQPPPTTPPPQNPTQNDPGQQGDGTPPPTPSSPVPENQYQAQQDNSTGWLDHFWQQYDGKYKQGVQLNPDQGQNFLARFQQNYDGIYKQQKPDPNTQKIPDAQWDYRTATTDKMGNPLPNGAVGWDPYGRPYYGPGLAGWWNGVVSRITDPGVQQAKFDFTQPTDLANGLGKLVNNAEQVGNLTDAFGVDSPLTPALRAIKEGLGAGFTALSLPAQLSERVIGTASELMRSDRQARNLDEAWQASRLTYSSFFDVAKRNQFLDQYRQGANPELLAMQLENPVAETVGQLVLDPTWVIGWITKGAEATRVLEEATQTALHSGAMQSEQVGRIVDALAGHAADDIAAHAGIAEVSGAVDKAMQAAKDGMLSYKPGFFSRLTSAQQWITSQVAGRHTEWLITTLQSLGKNPDEIGDALYHTAMLASDNPGERAVGLAYTLAHHPVPRMALSEEGLQTSATLWHTVDDPEKFLAGLENASKGGVEEVTKYALGRIQAASKDMYPSVTEMRQASELAAKGGEVSDRTAALAAQYKNLSPGVQAAERVAESAFGHAYRKVQGTLIGVYLSSPGYAVRNVINNVFTGYVDQGTKLFGRDGRIMLGGQALQELEDMLGGQVVHMQSFGKSGDLANEGLKLTNLVPKAADAGERGVRAMVMRASLQDTFSKLLQPGRFLPDLQPLVDAGMSPEQAGMFARMVLDENGNVDRAIERLRTMTTSTGYVDAWRDTSQLITPKMRQFLGKIGAYPETVDAVHADYQNADEAVQGIVGQIRKLLTDQAKTAAEDVIAVDQKAPGAVAAADLTEAARQGYVDAEKADIFTAMKQAGRNFETYVDKLGTQLGVLSPGGADNMKAVEQAFQDFPRIGAEVAAETDRVTKEAWDITNKIRSGETVDVGALYRKFLPGMEPSDNTQKFLTDLWDQRASTVRALWEKHYSNLQQRAEALYQGLRPSMTPENANTADALMQHGRDLFSHFDQVRQAMYDGKTLTVDPLAGKEGADYVRGLANLYGFSTATEQGVPTDNTLLAMINKYARDNAHNLAMPGAERRLVYGERRAVNIVLKHLPPEEVAKLPKIDFGTVQADEKAIFAGLSDAEKAKLEENAFRRAWSVVLRPDNMTRQEWDKEWPAIWQKYKDTGVNPLTERWNTPSFKYDAAWHGEHWRNITGGRRSTDLANLPPEMQLPPAGAENLHANPNVDLYKSLADVPKSVANSALEAWRNATGRDVPEGLQLAQAAASRDQAMAELAKGTQAAAPAADAAQAAATAAQVAAPAAQGATSLGATAGEAFQKAVTSPRSEMPPAVSDAMAQQAKTMLDEVLQGEPGKRTAAAVTHSSYPDWYGEIVKKGGRQSVIDALQKIIQDAGSDVGPMVERLKQVGLNSIWEGDLTNGIPPNLHLLQATGANESDISKALNTFNDIVSPGQDLSLEQALAKEQEWFNYGSDAFTAPPAAGAPTGPLDTAGAAQAAAATPESALTQGALGGTGVPPEPLFKKPIPVPYAGNMPSNGRIAEQSLKAIEPELQRMEQFIRDNWGKTMGSMGPEIDQAVGQYAQDAKSLIAQARRIGLNVADNAANFTLLDYAGGKKGIDAAAAYVLPFEFWPSRTYGNWLKRVYTDPGVLAAYAKYHDMNEKIHADLPEFYRQNVSTDDLLGVQTNSPLYFNLEATLWPLNGLTGVDFNDPYKRVDWWTATLDDLGKLGPGVATPITAATAVALYMKGEKDAAARWAGRLFPQTAQIKAALSLTNTKLPDTPFTKGNEFDPFVNFFSGGYDPYERRRIGGAGMQALVDQGKITQEQALDATNQQSGPIWDAAEMLATQQRAGATLSSWGLGVGWKGRTATDLRIDKFYSEYTALSAQIKAGSLSAQDTKQAFDALRTKYPFMDLVILSKKAGPDRDRAYAYNILSRVPPGQSTQLAQAAGISDALIQKFYDDKGDMSSWAASDHDKFMAAINDLGAVLSIPSNATQADWDKAHAAYTNLQNGMKQTFGADILDQIDAYYAIGNETQQQRDLQQNFLKLHPEVGSAMDMRTQAVEQIPELSAYYGGIKNIASYYSMQMYADLKAKLGADIYDKFAEYGSLKLTNQAQASAYWKAHPELGQYSDLRDQWQNYINVQIARAGSMLVQGAPAVPRPDIPQTTGTQAVQAALQGKPQMTWDQWSTVMPESLQRLVLDYFQSGHEIPASADYSLQKLASDYGYSDTNELLQAMGASLYQAAPAAGQP